MLGTAIFIAGMMVGGIFGVFTMCLFQINRLQEKEDSDEYQDD